MFEKVPKTLGMRGDLLVEKFDGFADLELARDAAVGKTDLWNIAYLF